MGLSAAGQRLLVAVRKELGDPQDWGAPVEFRDSLALCALNSAYSLRSKSGAVSNVLSRYRGVRATADHDSGPDLIRAMDSAGGPERFAKDVLESKSLLPGTRRLRTVGIYEGLGKLAELDVTTAADLRGAAGTPEPQRAWRSVLGFGPLAWSYLIMNAGIASESKYDVMLQRYVTRAVGGPEGNGPRLLAEVAEEMRVNLRNLDRAIWLYESARAGSKRGATSRGS